MIRKVNSILAVLSFVFAVGLILTSIKRADAVFEDPCPATIDSQGPCPAGYLTRIAWYGTACATGDPFWDPWDLLHTGTKYYRCCLYDAYNKRCYNDETGYSYAQGTREILRSTTAGSATCISTAPAHCLDN